MKAHIIYSKYLNEDCTKVTIGGVQTYITNLVDVLHECNYEVALYQCASKDYLVDWNGIQVIGTNYQSTRGYLIGDKLFSVCKKYANPKEDIIIFATDTLNVSTPGFKSISLQHGIYWDVPEENTKRSFLLGFITKARKAWQTVVRCSKVDTLVCVDYNFINWYRALVPYSKVNMVAIPNFTDIPKALEKKHEGITIIFARRFFKYRGTRVFADAVERILKEFEGVNVIVAGEGPDEEYMRNKLKDSSSITFTKYSSDESLKIHEKCDIAVVPTVGSEGTSLSLLEAMASQCAVICSNVGGMTNIVLDHYNGLMINSTPDDLYVALKELIQNNELRERIANKAHETVCQSFNIDKWKTDWKKVISKQ